MILKRTFLTLAIGVCCISNATAETIRIGIQNLPARSGNPFWSFNVPSALPLDVVFDALTIVDENGELRPALAERWEAETPNTWVFHLRDGVTFSNGEPFDSSAVVAAIDVILNSPEGQSSSLGTTFDRMTVSGAEARNRLTVAISTEQPDALFAQYMSALRVPAPQALQDMGIDAFALSPVGTGPFAVTGWSEGRVTFDAFEESWRDPQETGLEIIQLSDISARRQGVISGSLDVALGLAPEDRFALERAGGRMWVRPEPGTNFLAFLTVKNSPLQDVRVRKALNYAVNKQRIIDAFLDGAVPPTGQIAHSMSFGFAEDVRPYVYDPVQARLLLAEAGYADGFDLPMLLVPGGAANSQDWYQQIATDLAQVGVRMEIRPSTLPKYLEYMYGGGWPSLGFAMSTYTFDPLAAYRTRSCDWTHPYHCDESILPLIAKARAAATPEERRRLTKDVIRHEREVPPGIFLWQGVYFEGLGARVKDYWSGADTVAVERITLN